MVAMKLVCLMHNKACSSLTIRWMIAPRQVSRYSLDCVFHLSASSISENFLAMLTTAVLPVLISFKTVIFCLSVGISELRNAFTPSVKLPFSSMKDSSFIKLTRASILDYSLRDSLKESPRATDGASNLSSSNETCSLRYLSNFSSRSRI